MNFDEHHPIYVEFMTLRSLNFNHPFSPSENSDRGIFLTESRISIYHHLLRPLMNLVTFRTMPLTVCFPIYKTN